MSEQPQRNQETKNTEDNQSPTVPTTPANQGGAHQTASLYVGDLGEGVTESTLFETFQKIGPIASIRVCRDNSTRRSLGYAYVNYHRVEDAERAIDTLNYTDIVGVPCRIMWSQRDPTLRRSGVGNIFIKNLAPGIRSADLYDSFAQFGTVLSCKVATDANDKSKGFGFVHFEDAEAAEKAIEEVNGMEIEGMKVSVEHFKTKKQRNTGAGNVIFTNVYVKNLDKSVDEAELKKKAEEFGPTNSIIIMKDSNNVSKGFGFLNYENPEDAVKAVESLHESEYKGLTLFASRAQKKSERIKFLREKFEEKKSMYKESNLYVKNLDQTIDDKKLRDVFSSYGTIMSAKVMLDDNNISRGFGFVCFSTQEEAHKAAHELNGHMLSSKPLYVGLAQKKEVRSAQLQAQYARRSAPMTMPVMPYGAMLPNGQFPMRPNQNYMSPAFPAQVPRGRAGWSRSPAHQGVVYMQNPQNMMPPQNQIPPHQQTRHIAQQQQQQPAAAPNNQLSGIISSLSSMNEEQRKRALGDYLYQSINSFFQKNSDVEKADPGKITGMLLDSLDQQELINLAEDTNELEKRIIEAVQVLAEYNK